MFDPKIARKMAKEFTDSLPGDLKAVQQEMEKHMQQFLQQWFNKMSLVTREEFDIQANVLAKTRLKLTQLEATLEKISTAKTNDHTPKT